MIRCQFDYRSDVLGFMTTAEVLLPGPHVPGPYAVMLLLHGYSDDQSAWTRQTSLERYVEGLPLIVVMPNGGHSFYCDAVEGYAYGTAIGKELPELIDQYFPTNGQWVTAGLSMGGYGALRLALAYPDRFKSAVSLSGALGFGHDKTDYKGGDYDAALRRIVGPDPTGGPMDLYHLVKTATPRPEIRIDCGDDDFLIQHNRDFHAFLEAEGIPHEYVENPGAHTWEYWDEHIRPAIAFHKRILGL